MNAEPILDAIADQVGVNNIVWWLVQRPEMNGHWSFSKLRARPYFLVVGDEAPTAWRGAEAALNKKSAEIEASERRARLIKRRADNIEASA